MKNALCLSGGAFIYTLSDPETGEVRYVGKATNFIKEYPCVKLAGEETGICEAGIASVARGKRKTAGKFIWKYKDNINA